VAPIGGPAAVTDLGSVLDLGAEQEAAGDTEAARRTYEWATELAPQLAEPRRRLLALLARSGTPQARPDLWQAEVRSGADGVAWMGSMIVSAMQSRDLTAAGELAALHATLQWGSRWYPPSAAGPTSAPPDPPATNLSLSKLRHDADQFRHLRRVGVLDADFDAIIERFDAIADRLRPIGIDGREPLQGDDLAAIGDVYGRIVHVRHTPRLERALSPEWDRATAEHKYLDIRPGIIVIDDFLDPPALESLRRFCLESTIWSRNRYANGRLGSLFFSGFNCPLLLQIAEEIRDALPQVIGSRYPLRQLWGYKYQPYLPPGSTIHADFAAVNVNFWITPETANEDPSSGGMVIYDTDAPLSWDFSSYNERSDLIREFLRQRNARAIRIPYRQNRAVIFNSDLFHATDEVRFAPGYENHRINVTMLYGDREHDNHHPQISSPTSFLDPPIEAPSAWRSAAFSHRRGGR